MLRPFTPRHNGKVEHSHRKDNERFYATHLFYSFEDFSEQLKVYNRRDYNNFPMRPWGGKHPMKCFRNICGPCNKCLTNLHILGSLLENALEVCMRQTEGQKYLRLDICMHHESTLAIVVKNSHSGQVRKKEGVFLSSKAERRTGIWIASVRKVARKYNGVCQFDYTPRTFKTPILLNATDNHDHPSNGWFARPYKGLLPASA